MDNLGAGLGLDRDASSINCKEDEIVLAVGTETTASLEELWTTDRGVSPASASPKLVSSRCICCCDTVMLSGTAQDLFTDREKDVWCNGTFGGFWRPSMTAGINGL